jgi:hypothetical protein
VWAEEALSQRNTGDIRRESLDKKQVRLHRLMPPWARPTASSAVAFACAASFVACSLFYDADRLGDEPRPADNREGETPDPAGDATVADTPDASGDGDSEGDAAAIADAGSQDVSVDPATGCPSGRGPRMVRVTTYCIDATEVTRDDYQAFVRAGVGTDGQPSSCEQNTSFAPLEIDGGAPSGTWPITGIDWCDAVAYCKWAGKRLCGRVDGGSLARSDESNAGVSEWFRACSNDGTRDYPYGTAQLAGACNAGGNGPLEPVGTRSGCQGGYPGLFDFVGNAREWIDVCANPSPNATCSARGGTVGTSDAGCATVELRARLERSATTGFRCCADAR